MIKFTEIKSKKKSYWCGTCGKRGNAVKLYKVDNGKKKVFVCQDCISTIVNPLAEMVDEKIKEDINRVVEGTRFEGMAKTKIGRVDNYDDSEYRYYSN